MNEAFRKFAHKCSHLAGTPWAFVFAIAVIAVWGILGPYLKFSNTWQLLINTFTTISTFIMVFLIQNTQNRDSLSLHLKLDELIRSSSHARNILIDLEEASDEELERVHSELMNMREQTDKKLEHVKGHRRRRKAKAA